MRGILFSSLIILMCNLVFAVPEIIFQNEEIRVGETALAEIFVDGNFTKEISDSDIKFLDGRKTIFIEHEIHYYNGVHYLSVYTTREGNFTLEISDILYKVGDSLLSHKISFPFNVTSASFFDEESNSTVKQSLSVRPGFFISTSKPTIKLINKGDSPLDVEYQDTKGNLTPMQTAEIIWEPEDVFSKLEISSYKNFVIPIVYLSAGNNNFSAPEEPKVRVSPELILANVIIGNPKETKIQVFNLMNDSNLTDISFFTDASFITFGDFSNTLGPRGVLNVSLFLDPEVDGKIDEEINFSYSQSGKSWLINIPVSLYSLPPGSNESSFETEVDSCEDIGGQDCGDLVCAGEALFTKNDEYCCLGECKEIDLGSAGSEGSGSFGWVWALLIFVLLGIVGFYFWKRSKKVGPGNPEDKIKSASKSFDDKMKGTPPPQRVKGNVQRNI